MGPHRFIKPFTLLRNLACLTLLLGPGLDMRAGAAEINHASPFDDTIRSLKKPPRMARLRVPVALTPWFKVVVTDKKGVKRHEVKAGPVMRRTLRARIERINHFYIGEWHIETVPMVWKKKTRTYSMKVRVYKRFGQDKDLEEYLGHFLVSGNLTGGKDLLYEFQGKQQRVFSNRGGEKILGVQVGRPAALAKSGTGPAKGRVAVGAPRQDPASKKQ